VADFDFSFGPAIQPIIFLWIFIFLYFDLPEILGIHATFLQNCDG
jgi:hypothetical protein